jgi:hypothetical protein
MCTMRIHVSIQNREKTHHDDFVFGLFEIARTPSSVSDSDFGEKKIAVVC